jgi:hypothetical protein
VIACVFLHLLIHSSSRFCVSLQCAGVHSWGWRYRVNLMKFNAVGGNNKREMTMRNRIKLLGKQLKWTEEKQCHWPGSLGHSLGWTTWGENRMRRCHAWLPECKFRLLNIAINSWL